MRSRFLRRAGEHATFVPCPTADAEPGPAFYRELLHGDILYDPEAYRDRALGSYVVIEEGINKRVKPISENHELGLIERSVSALIEDPVQFYAQVPEGTCVEIVELDADAHREFVEKCAGGRPVHASRDVWWTFGNENCAQIRSPRSPDIPTETIVVELDARTPDKYLGAITTLLVDPVMEEYRGQNRNVHEVWAHAYLRGLRANATMLIRNLPNDKDKWGIRETLFEVIKDPANPHKVAAVRTFNRSRLVTYTPRVLTDLGPYGGVAVWASGDRNGPIPMEFGMLTFPDLEK